MGTMNTFFTIGVIIPVAPENPGTGGLSSYCIVREQRMPSEAAESAIYSPDISLSRLYI
jgi:hypothetical protein